MTSSSNLPAETTEHARPGIGSSNRVAGIFAKFHARYGRKFSASFPPGEVLQLALEEWRLGLADYTDQEIMRGLTSWKGAWPPSLPEFQLACRPPATPAMYRPYSALPKPKACRDLARSALKKLQERLNH